MKAVRLLRAAAQLYDNPQTNLAEKVEPKGGFQTGGEWMRQVLETLRGKKIPQKVIAFHFLGIAKYGLASFAALLGVASLWFGVPWWCAAPLVVVAFYAVEVQFVFLFPLAIDEVPRPWAEARKMTRRMTTVGAMWVVLPLAVVMLFGGFFGQGFVRSWCLGCLSVVLWYEEQREAARRLPVRIERITGSAGIRLLWVTDIHLRARQFDEIAARLVRTARAVRPGLIVLGGDLVEEANALPAFGRLLRLLSAIAPTHVLPGNHDRRAGEKAFRKVVEESPAMWHEAPGFALDGEKVMRLTESLPINSLVFVHDPGVLDKIKGRWLAAFAGHLHGGQAVFWRKGDLEYPGAWLSRWNGPRVESPQGPVIVSRGITDTLPLRWNCPKEIILCEIC